MHGSSRFLMLRFVRRTVFQGFNVFPQFGEAIEYEGTAEEHNQGEQQVYDGKEELDDIHDLTCFRFSSAA